MNKPATNETTKLTAGYDTRYNDAYNQGFLAGKNKQTAVDAARQLADSLENNQLWNRRRLSFLDLMGIIFIGAIIVSFAISIFIGVLWTTVKWLIFDMMKSGIEMYQLLAPALLLVVLTFIFSEIYRSRK